MSYTPPLEIETDVEKIAEEVKTKGEEFVMKSVRSLTLKADKDELVKALAYDRDQYQKGYEDGYKDSKEDMKEDMKILAKIVGELIDEHDKIVRTLNTLKENDR